jgi:hypothetical protein
MPGPPLAGDAHHDSRPRRRPRNIPSSVVGVGPCWSGRYTAPALDTAGEVEEEPPRGISPTCTANAVAGLHAAAHEVVAILSARGERIRDSCTCAHRRPP